MTAVKSGSSILRKPDAYLATPQLCAAVDVVLTLGMPLLLTGEPGSGKSSQAESLAWAGCCASRSSVIPNSG